MPPSPAAAQSIEHASQASNVRIMRPIWQKIRQEADEILRHEPALAPLIRDTVLDAHDLVDAIGRRLARRLDHAELPGATIRQAYAEFASATPSLILTQEADMRAVQTRDPATTRLIEPLLYFKGFQTIQVHRLAHWLWNNCRQDFALYLQSRVSSIFQTDIHPAAKLGQGLFFDHATGLTVGSTAVIEDDVSILQGVTLGGTGKERGDRHPKIRRGVLIGAGAKILGNIEIGHCSRIAAGSVVLKAVPPMMTVAGVPAKIIGESGCSEPSHMMDQMLYDIAAD